MFFILGERERDGEREEEKRGLILSNFFFQVWCDQEEETRGRKKKRKD